MDYRASIPRAETYENHIEIENIDRINTAKFFDTVTERTEEINNLLIHVCRDVFTESYNKGGREAGAILDVQSMEYAIHRATQYGRINFSDDTATDYYKIHDKANKRSCIVIHNHNSKQSFSAQDILALVLDVKVTAIVVITCNGCINMIIKTKHKDYTDIIRDIYSNYKTDFITPSTRALMNQRELFERRVTI